MAPGARLPAAIPGVPDLTVCSERTSVPAHTRRSHPPLWPGHSSSDCLLTAYQYLFTLAASCSLAWPLLPDYLLIAYLLLRATVA